MNEMNNDVDLNIIILQCQKILKYYDLFVLDSPLDSNSNSIDSGNSIDSYNNNNQSISYEEADYIILPIDQVIIYGRCRDYSALSLSRRNIININKNHLFLCIKTLFATTSNVTSTYKVCISNLDSYHNHIKRIGIDQIEVIAKLLSAHYINVLLTCEAIDAEILSMFVKYGIYTVSIKCN